MNEGIKLADTLSKKLEDLRYSISDAEKSFAKSTLQPATRDDVVELCLIRAVGLFEEYLGDLFIMTMEGNLGSDFQPQLQVGGKEEALLFVSGVDQAGSERYTAWLPFKEKTLHRASKLLSNGLPFSRLANRPTEKQALVDLVTIRNRIAHDSESARHKFKTLALQKGYPHSRAADYLTSTRGTDTEIILGLARLEAIAKGLVADNDENSRVYLDPEGSFSPSMVAPPGSYLCERYGHRVTIGEHSTLGNCGNCPKPSRCQYCGRAEKVQTSWQREV